MKLPGPFPVQGPIALYFTGRTFIPEGLAATKNWILDVTEEPDSPYWICQNAGKFDGLIS
jgi:hypothetical protein